MQIIKHRKYCYYNGVHLSAPFIKDTKYIAETTCMRCKNKTLTFNFSTFTTSDDISVLVAWSREIQEKNCYV